MKTGCGQLRALHLRFANMLEIRRRNESVGKLRFVCLAVVTIGLCHALEEPAGAESALEEGAEEVVMSPEETMKDASYALGFRTGGGFAQEFGRYGVTAEDLDMEIFLSGFTTALKGDAPDMEEERLQMAMTSLGTILEDREKEKAAKNLEEGKKFLEENKNAEGVVTLDSGLQYKILEKGGEEKYVEPKEDEPAKQFMVNYKGELIDGTEFDSSPEGQPIPMTLQVIPGFKEALTSMPVGAKWRLFIPSELAYGEERRSADIGPNTVLIFDLELVEINDAPPAPAPQGLPMAAPQGE